VKIAILRGSLAEAHDRGVLAIGHEGGPWVLVNLSAAVALELGARRRPPARLQFGAGPPCGLILTDAHVQHSGGLLSLREGAPVELYATPAVFEDLTSALPLLPVLEHYCGVHWHVVPVAGDRRVAVFHVPALPALEFTALAVDGPAPPHSTHSEEPLVGDNVALVVRDRHSGQTAFCAPALAQIGPLEFDWMRQADCVLVDSADHGALAASRAPWIELLSDLPARHKVLWRVDPEATRAAGAAAGENLVGHGIAMAYDGMEIVL
jgi:pyrroloquinoline quinone biosynthesis protein B